MSKRNKRAARRRPGTIVPRSIPQKEIQYGKSPIMTAIQGARAIDVAPTRTAGYLTAQINQIESIASMTHSMCEAIEHVLCDLGVPLGSAGSPTKPDGVPPGQLGRLAGAIAASAGASDRVRVITERLQSLI